MASSAICILTSTIQLVFSKELRIVQGHRSVGYVAFVSLSVSCVTAIHLSIKSLADQMKICVTPLTRPLHVTLHTTANINVAMIASMILSFAMSAAMKHDLKTHSKYMRILYKFIFINFGPRLFALIFLWIFFWMDRYTAYSLAVFVQFIFGYHRIYSHGDKVYRKVFITFNVLGLILTAIMICIVFAGIPESIITIATVSHFSSLVSGIMAYNVLGNISYS